MPVTTTRRGGASPEEEEDADDDDEELAEGADDEADCGAMRAGVRAGVGGGGHARAVRGGGQREAEGRRVAKPFSGGYGAQGGGRRAR